MLRLTGRIVPHLPLKGVRALWINGCSASLGIERASRCWPLLVAFPLRVSLPIRLEASVALPANPTFPFPFLFSRLLVPRPPSVFWQSRTSRLAIMPCLPNFCCSQLPSGGSHGAFLPARGHWSRARRASRCHCCHAELATYKLRPS